MKRLLTGTALLTICLPAAAFAAGANDTMGSDAARPAPPMAGESSSPADRVQVSPNAAASQDVIAQTNGVAVISTMALSSRYLRGADVVGSDSNKLGSIDDIVFDQSGNAQLALISTGGVAGIGGKTVGLNFSELSFSGQDAKSKVAKIGNSQADLESQAAVDKAKLPTGQVLTSNYLGSDVRLQGSDDMAKISDLILDEKGRARYAAIDFGGMLGVGNKRVAIAFDKLGQPVKDQPIQLQATLAELKAQPPFVYSTDETTSSIPSMSGSSPQSGNAAPSRY